MTTIVMKKLHKYNKQEKTLFGKKINVDTTKELQDQHWFKSDLFSGRQKDFIEDVWEMAGSKINKIEEIGQEEEKS